METGKVEGTSDAIIDGETCRVRHEGITEKLKEVEGTTEKLKEMESREVTGVMNEVTELTETQGEMQELTETAETREMEQVEGDELYEA